jgi:hypothetical protein
VNIHTIKGAIPEARPIAVAGLTESEYRDLPGLTQSEINLFCRSPRLYKLNAREESDAMRMGTLLHSAVLLKRVDCYVRPAFYGPEGKIWNNNAKECRAWNEAHSDKPILSEDEKRDLDCAAGIVGMTDGVGYLLQNGEAEVALLCAAGKGRIDYIVDRGDYLDVVDLKTTRDGRFRAMQRTIHERGYHIQAAWYRRLLREIDPRPIRYRIIAVELAPVVRAQAWTLSERAINLGDERIDWALERMEECQATGNWPAWHNHDMGPDGLIDLPEYAYPEPEITGMTEVQA